MLTMMSVSKVLLIDVGLLFSAPLDKDEEEQPLIPVT